MKVFLGVGDAVNVTATAAVVSGQPLLVGSLFGICGADAAINKKVALWTKGVYDVPKASGAWTEGQLIYWDAAALNFTTASTSGHTKVGVAVEAATSGATTGRVRLSGRP
jgi:predicted RecA/RadA family phage recombinase